MTSRGCDNENHRRCILDLTFPLRPPGRSEGDLAIAAKSPFSLKQRWTHLKTDCHQPVSSPIFESLGALQKVAIIDPFGVIGHGSWVIGHGSRVTGHGALAPSVHTDSQEAAWLGITATAKRKGQFLVCVPEQHPGDRRAV